jgi:hypothetical protein
LTLEQGQPAVPDTFETVVVDFDTIDAPGRRKDLCLRLDQLSSEYPSDRSQSSIEVEPL